MLGSIDEGTPSKPGHEFQPQSCDVRFAMSTQCHAECHEECHAQCHAMSTQCHADRDIYATRCAHIGEVEHDVRPAAIGSLAWCR